MKDLNKEQILFIAVLLILGVLTYFRVGDMVKSRRVPRAKGTLEVESLPPCPEIQFVDTDGAFSAGEGRNIFAPPRDWLPLDPLLLEAPPQLTLTVVAPLPEPGLGPKHFDQYHVLPGKQLEAPEEAEAVEGETNEEEEGTIGVGAFEIETKPEDAFEDPDAAFLPIYDWIKLDGQLSRVFGYIKNEDKYALGKNREPIRFAQVAKRTGNILGTYEYTRDRIDDFGFADTVVNRIELAICDLRFNAGNLVVIHAKARWCLALREEDPKAVDYAVDLVERAIALDPLSRESYKLLADIYEIALDRERELRVLHRAIEQNLNAPGVYVRYGRLLQRFGMNDAALKAFLQAEEIKPYFAESRVARAELDYGQGLYPEALDLFDRARRSATWDVDLGMRVFLGKARVLLAMNDLTGATIEVQRALTDGKENGETWNLKGAVALAKGELDDAEDAFRRAGELDPGHYRYRYNMGDLLFKRGLLEEAVRKFEETILLDPYHSCRPTAARGFVNEYRGEDSLASSDYELAVQVDPLDFYALYLLGRNQRKQGDLETAMTTLKRALRLNGRMREILGELGHARLLAGQDEDAAFYFDEYLKRGEEDFRVDYLYGLALLNLKRFGEAVSLFERSLALSGGQPDPYNGIAYARYIEGEVDAALDAFNEVIRTFEEEDTDPRHVYARRWRDRIEVHRRMSQWIDGFQRKQVKNDWTLQQRSGPKISLISNRIIIQGNQRPDQPDEHTAIKRVLAKGGTFRILEADTVSLEGNQAMNGIFIGSYIRRGNQEAQVRVEVTLAVDAGGNLVYNIVDKNDTVVEWERLDHEKIEQDAPVRLGIELVDYENGVVRLTADGNSLLGRELIVKSLRKNTRPLTLGVFAAAAGGRKVQVGLDEVRIVVQN